MRYIRTQRLALGAWIPAYGHAGRIDILQTFRVLENPIELLSEQYLLVIIQLKMGKPRNSFNVSLGEGRSHRQNSFRAYDT